jgi:uncharacterized protein (DUF302 family)
MAIKRISVERFFIESSKSFEEVLMDIEKGIGRPEMRLLRAQMDQAPTFSEFQRLVEGAVGPADLMEFLRLDLGTAMRKDPAAKPYKIVRIIAGNPLIMKQMVEQVADAGSYAPVTILVYERKGKVHLCYDTMESLLTPYQNGSALKVAKDLDSKVIRLLTDAAG